MKTFKDIFTGDVMVYNSKSYEILYEGTIMKVQGELVIDIPGTGEIIDALHYAGLEQIELNTRQILNYLSD